MVDAVTLVGVCLIMAAVAAWLLYVLKILVHPHLVLLEALAPKSASALGAMVLTTIALCARLTTPVGIPALYSVWALAIGYCALFLVQSYRTGLPIEPGCFPACCPVGLVPSAGVVLGASPSARDDALCMALIISVVLTPPVCYSALTMDRSAASPRLWLLTAPWTLCSRAWFESDGGRFIPEVARGWDLG